jgi:hypothetical protein
MPPSLSTRQDAPPRTAHRALRTGNERLERPGETGRTIGCVEKQREPLRAPPDVPPRDERFHVRWLQHGVVQEDVLTA